MSTIFKLIAHVLLGSSADPENPTFDLVKVESFSNYKGFGSNFKTHALLNFKRATPRQSYPSMLDPARAADSPKHYFEIRYSSLLVEFLWAKSSHIFRTLIYRFIVKKQIVRIPK